MKLLTNFTIFSEHIDHDKWLQIVAKDCNLKLEKYIKGCHREAPRVHIHIMAIWTASIPIKYLNQKISRMKNNYEEFKNVDIRTCFTYQDNIYRSNPKNEYNESVMMYPLKEYNAFHDEIAYQGFTPLEVENMRKEASKIWDRIKEKKTKLKETKRGVNDLYKYIDQFTDHMNMSYPSYADKKKEILKIILKYKKEKEDKIYFNQLKDLTINYLYSRNKITEYDIIENVYL